jgi:CDP-diacylglycerol pyrophosphatase
LYRAKTGAIHFLLLPLQPISGIESQQLFSASAIDYLALGWQERQIVSHAYGRPVPDNALAISINSVSGRSQNQLHLHLSCLRQDIRVLLQQWSKSASANGWQPIRLRQHDYLARILSLPQIKQKNLLQRIADEIPNFRTNSGEYGVALTRLPDGRMVLLVVRRALWKMNFAHPEELQDNQCSAASSD